MDRNGAMVLVNGIFEIMRLGPRDVAWTLKIQPFDVVRETNAQQLSLSAYHPTYAWVSSGDFDSNRGQVNRFRCADGSFCLAGGEGLNDATELLLEARRLRLGIQRRVGGSDAVTDIVLVSDQRDLERQARLGRCMSDFTRTMRTPN